MAAIAVIKPGATTTNLGAGTAAAAGGDTVANDGKTLLRFKSTHSSNITVTIAMPKASPNSWLTYPDATIVVPLTTGDVVKGPFPQELFNDADGNLALTYDAVTTLLVWPISAGG